MLAYNTLLAITFLGIDISQKNYAFMLHIWINFVYTHMYISAM